MSLHDRWWRRGPEKSTIFAATASQTTCNCQCKFGHLLTGGTRHELDVWNCYDLPIFTIAAVTPAWGIWSPGSGLCASCSGWFDMFDTVYVGCDVYPCRHFSISRVADDDSLQRSPKCRKWRLEGHNGMFWTETRLFLTFTSRSQRLAA